jgi:LuxR family maltose regulon positive regulatory protein
MDKNSISKVLNDIVQQNPLLTTKLFVPGVSRNLVSRPRLTDRLDQSLACALTVISAPAGYGKTTLLSEWVADFRLPILDFGLNEIENRESPGRPVRAGKI